MKPTPNSTPDTPLNHIQLKNSAPDSPHWYEAHINGQPSYRPAVHVLHKKNAPPGERFYVLTIDPTKEANHGGVVSRYIDTVPELCEYLRFVLDPQLF